ncbi:MAG TPA: GNAT family N-acetyltransferase [Bryobacteraceae bacterium]|jgi:GNAT superfamily N-acetyltransferase
MEIKIREFHPGDEAAFRRLNEEWITRYFVLEAKDSYSLEHPQEAILDGGGRIFLAFDGNEAVGCCALMALAPGEFEVAKMAVTETRQGFGIGRKLLQHVVDEAEASGATRLYLETNQKLVTAITLYESLGFRHLRREEITPSPYARANVYMERRAPILISSPPE